MKSNKSDLNNYESKRFIESGDIFFFYRPKIDTEEVKDIEDVQRFYMVTCNDINKNTNKNKNKKYRLFMLGSKKMPEILEGKSGSEERSWALNILTTSNADVIHNELLLPVEYTTKTRGKRRLSAAQPAGEGKYSIIRHDGHTELAYILEIPEDPGPIQTEFEIKKEASYIVSVKNPEIFIPGYDAFSKKDRKPNYPKHIKEKFGEKRWINVDDPEILNYENTQLLLIGTRKRNVEEELGIEIDEEKENKNSVDIFKELKIKKEEIPLRPFLKGKFPTEEEIPMSQGLKKIPSEKAPGVKGGQKGGKIAAIKSPSAAAIAKMLSGIHFPVTKTELVKFAHKKDKSTVVENANEEIFDILNKLLEKAYYKITDVEIEVGKLR
ncbi:MAG TPA: DUF2795 domain-containing protein [Nitrososphaeraceae archaeon]|nr:DUF2795 domain-containing protein [Nitrososphaeraceae archaeon]